jgi:hypothetical protein
MWCLCVREKNYLCCSAHRLKFLGPPLKTGTKSWFWRPLIKASMWGEMCWIKLFLFLFVVSKDLFQHYKLLSSYQNIRCLRSRASPYFFETLVQNDRKGPYSHTHITRTVYFNLKKISYFNNKEYSVHTLKMIEHDSKNNNICDLPQLGGQGRTCLLQKEYVCQNWWLYEAFVLCI